MLRVRNFLMALSLAIFPLGCTPVGCSGEDPEQDLPADEQFVGAVEQQLPAPVPGASSLYGTWNGKANGYFDQLVLMTNGRYHTALAVTCVKAPCDPLTREGSFKLFLREGRSYIELGTTEPTPVRFEYALTSGDNLRLRPLVKGSEWFALEHSAIAWCATGRECTVQNLPPGICAGKYECAQSACVWKCVMGGEPSAVDTGATDAVKPTDTKTP
jgi:hypothetical protein